VKKGDIVFIQGRGIVSRLVRLFDGNKRFSHVASYS